MCLLYSRWVLTACLLSIVPSNNPGSPEGVGTDLYGDILPSAAIGRFGTHFPPALGLQQSSEARSNDMMVIRHEDAKGHWKPQPSLESRRAPSFRPSLIPLRVFLQVVSFAHACPVSQRPTCFVRFFPVRLPSGPFPGLDHSLPVRRGLRHHVSESWRLDCPNAAECWTNFPAQS